MNAERLRGSRMSTVGLEEVFSLQRFRTAFPNTIYFDSKLNQDKHVSVYGTQMFRNGGNLGLGERYPVVFHDRQRACVVHVNASSPSGPLNEGGMWLVTAGSVKLVAGAMGAAEKNVAVQALLCL